jgi:hypothetical protein
LEKIEMNKNLKSKVTVTVELPSDTLEFLQASVPDVKKYLEYTIVEAVRADRDNGEIFAENSTEIDKAA